MCLSISSVGPSNIFNMLNSVGWPSNTSFVCSSCKQTVGFSSLVNELSVTTVQLKDNRICMLMNQFGYACKAFVIGTGLSAHFSLLVDTLCWPVEPAL